MTVTQNDVTGGPFISFESQEDADNMAKAAVQNQGQDIVNRNGTCTWTGTASKSFTRNNCGTCKYGQSITVTSAMIGGTYTSTVSRTDANNKAMTALNSQGQSYANSHASCYNSSTTASWNATGNTRCSGCTSQRELKDTNSCSSTYNQTRWENGGSRNCSENGSWSSWSGSCSGCTYNSYRTNTCGGRQDNTSYNHSDCGSTSYEYRCSGTTRQRRSNNTCSGYGGWTNYETNSCSCGYTGSYSATSEYRCYNGTSQRKYTEKCGGVDWRNEGTACTATNDKVCKSGCDCETCIEAGAVTMYGSTTSAAKTSANQEATKRAGNLTCRSSWKNAQQSWTATKNNCPSGCTGSQSTTVIGAGHVISCISQADANSRALQMAKDGAQEYANSNGSCNCGKSSLVGRMTYSINNYVASGMNSGSGYVDINLSLSSTCPGTVKYRATLYNQDNLLGVSFNGAPQGIVIGEISSGGTLRKSQSFTFQAQGSFKYMADSLLFHISLEQISGNTCEVESRYSFNGCSNC